MNNCVYGLKRGDFIEVYFIGQSQVYSFIWSTCDNGEQRLPSDVELMMVNGHTVYQPAAGIYPKGPRIIPNTELRSGGNL